MRFTATIIIWLMVSTALQLQAQIVAQPEAPVLYSVSIDPETGFIILRWIPPGKGPVIDYYKVEEIRENGASTVLMTRIYDTMAVLTYDLPLFQSVGLLIVGAQDDGGDGYDGDWSNIDSTIFLKTTYDTCQSMISLAWNDYNSWRGSIAQYNIYRYMSPGMYELISTIPGGTNTLELRNLLPNVTYDLFVEAVNNDGRTSTSNRRVVETRMPDMPVAVNADYATISPGNSIQLSFSVQGPTGMTNYDLLRSSTFDGNYSKIGTINTADAQFGYTDDVRFTSNVQYYKIQIINDCGVAAIESNRANNIILKGSFINMLSSLEWNEYRDWSGGVEAYRVTRTIGRTNPDTVIVYTGGNTFLSDDVGSLINYTDPAEGLICYSVEATENMNSLGIKGHSISNKVCFSVTPEIRMPNAFIPNDQEQLNQEFAPVFSFLPEHYEMTIYNRLGLKIWEGTGPWDGRANGNYVPEGVYLYYLKVFSYTSEITELNGKVTVLYR